MNGHGIRLYADFIVGTFLPKTPSDKRDITDGHENSTFHYPNKYFVKIRLEAMSLSFE
jgi:hypothetical protein